MRKVIEKYGKYIAAVALVVTSICVNTTCPFATYQPELPKNAKKLRKF